MRSHSFLGFSLLTATYAAASNEKMNTQERITVSGISAGAFMASQFHVAFSSRVEGVGILAGGPFYCAMDDVALAEGRCSTFLFFVFC
jgi:poly(3-hydroxybutyrate) depolymerase